MKIRTKEDKDNMHADEGVYPETLTRTPRHWCELVRTQSLDGRLVYGFQMPDTITLASYKCENTLSKFVFFLL